MYSQVVDVRFAQGCDLSILTSISKLKLCLIPLLQIGCIKPCRYAEAPPHSSTDLASNYEHLEHDICRTSLLYIAQRSTC